MNVSWLHRALANGPELRQVMSVWHSVIDSFVPTAALVGPDGFTPVGIDILVPRKKPANDN